MKKILIYFIGAGILLALLSCSEGQVETTWKIINHTDCKNNILDEEITTSESCISYEYIDNTLYITHINAGFNCCPYNFDIDVRITDNKIIIDETAIDGDCDCLCLYDVDLKIKDLPADIYNIVVLEPLLTKNDKNIDFFVRLTKIKKDIYCVDRSSYPWGL